MDNEITPVDVLAVGAHPDDIEINCSGTLLVLGSKGRRVGLVDMTRGELGTLGDPETRARESDQAAAILEAEFRTNLELPDGSLQSNEENRHKLIRVIRACRPRLVITHSGFGHPDHGSCRQIVEEAVHHAGLAKLDTGRERFRPEKIAFWISFDQPCLPEVAVDISTVRETKEVAIRCYRSQLQSGNGDRSRTYLSAPDFLTRLRSFDNHLGSLAGCEFAEGFALSRLPRMGDLTEC